MDDYPGRRTVDGLVVPKKGSSIVLRETANSGDQNVQFCNRLGCSGRMNSTKGTRFGSSEKPKPLRPLIRSSIGKEIVGSSSRTSFAESSLRKSCKEPRKMLSSQVETDTSVISTSLHSEPEVSELIPAPGKTQRGLQSDSEYTESGESTSKEVGSSSITSTTRKQRNLKKKSALANQVTLPGSSTSSAPKSTLQGVRHGTSASRYGLKSLRCNSISDVIPSGCSSPDSSHNRKKPIVKTRNSNGESSSFSRGKKMSGSSLEGRGNSSSTHGVSISDSSRARNWLSSNDNGNDASHRTRRSINGNPRVRLSNQGNRNNLSQIESSTITRQMAEPEIPITVNAPGSSRRISAENHSRSPNFYSRPGSSSDSLHSRLPVSPSEVGISRSLMNRDGFQHYNMDGIAEVLLALERIEQDEELSYEQLLVLETNLFLNGLSFSDQHRDMRLDIDNMSYEELLALEERMGTVSTALPEEALTKCLKSSTYKFTPPEAQANDVGGDDKDDDDDDVKCSICQEEYAIGDELGRLKCEHRFHVDCIHQWLKLKNWCPICKISAAPSPSSAPS